MIQMQSRCLSHQASVFHYLCINLIKCVTDPGLITSHRILENQALQLTITSLETETDITLQIYFAHKITELAGSLTIKYLILIHSETWIICTGQTFFIYDFIWKVQRVQNGTLLTLEIVNMQICLPAVFGNVFSLIVALFTFFVLCSVILFKWTIT